MSADGLSYAVGEQLKVSKHTFFEPSIQQAKLNFRELETPREILAMYRLEQSTPPALGRREHVPGDDTGGERGRE